MKKLLKWYFNLCRQDSLELRKKERMSPSWWHKDFLVLRFINRNIKQAVEQYSLRQKRILDLGCSHKPYADLFDAAEYYGVDFSDEAKEVDYKADLNQPLTLQRQFDAVVCFDTFEHVLNTMEALNTVHNHLPNNGYAIITTPFLFGVHDAPTDFHRFTEYFYKHVPHPGLELVSIERSTTYPASLMVHKNYFLYRLPIPYFFKYPFYLFVNICASLVDWLARQVAKISLAWLQEFIWSGPLEYFVVLRRK